MLDDATCRLSDVVQSDILEKLNTSLSGIPWANFNSPILRIEAFIQDGTDRDLDSDTLKTSERLHHVFSVRRVY
jgi:hypothetical protein